MYVRVDLHFLSTFSYAVLITVSESDEPDDILRDLSELRLDWKIFKTPK